MLANKKIIKYTKPTTDPLVIGPGGSNIVKKEPEPPRQVQHGGGLVIGPAGVVRQQPPQPKPPEQKDPFSHQFVSDRPNIQDQPKPVANTPLPPAPDPGTARTIKLEKMIEEQKARAEQMLEEAEMKQKLANQQLEEAQIKAKEIIKEHQIKAKKLIEDAKQYCQQLQSGAEREGFEQGKSLGLEAGKQEVGILMQQAMGLINHVLEERRKFFEGIEPQIADLALEIGKKVIQTEVTVNKDIVLNLIKTNLSKVSDREEIIIKVCPDDYQYVKENEDSIRKLLDGAKKFRIDADGVVDRGGCMIETNLGNLDSRIDFQLEILSLAFEQIKKVSGT